MPLEPRPGLLLPVPCRNCGEFRSLRVSQGMSWFRCEKCGKRTDVELYPAGNAWKVRTRIGTD